MPEQDDEQTTEAKPTITIAELDGTAGDDAKETITIAEAKPTITIAERQKDKDKNADDE